MSRAEENKNGEISDAIKVLGREQKESLIDSIRGTNHQNMNEGEKSVQIIFDDVVKIVFIYPTNNSNNSQM
jgi:hypothetical protein